MICCKAKAVSRGKPITTPMETIIKGSRSLASGIFARKMISKIVANIAAIVARIDVKNTGSKPATASFVAGREALKMSTPINPFSQPRDGFCMDGFCMDDFCMEIAFLCNMDCQKRMN